MLVAATGRAALADHTAPPAKDADAVQAAAKAHAEEKAAGHAQLDERRKAAAKVEAAQQALLRQQAAELQKAVQAKTYLRPFRERLDLETRFIERTCGLTVDQAAELLKQSAAIAERAQTELAKALTTRAGQGMAGRAMGGLRMAGGGMVPQQVVVIVNGNAVAVPAGVSSEFLTNPAQAARDELRRAAAETLPEAARARLDEADVERHLRTLVTTRLAALLVLDEALLLSTRQREAVGELLDAAWTVPVSSDRNPILAGSPHAVEMLHGARLVLPKAKLAALLRPAQQAALKSLSEPAAQVAPAGGPRVLRVDRPAAAVKLNVMGGMGRRAIVMQRVQLNAKAGQQWIAALQTFNAAVQPANYLELLVDETAAAGDLSEDQRSKLLLAGRLDLKRVAPRPKAEAARGAAVDREAGMAPQGQFAQQDNDHFIFEADKVHLFGALGPEKVFSEPSSAYQKTLRGKLSAEQLKRLASAWHERLVLHQRATVAAVLQALDERVLLSAEQHQHLAEFFEQQLAAGPAVGLDDPQLETIWRLSRVLPRDLQPMFDETQRPIAASFWQELCAAVPK